LIFIYLKLYYLIAFMQLVAYNEFNFTFILINPGK
jgi:hypothetical protein